MSPAKPRPPVVLNGGTGQATTEPTPVVVIPGETTHGASADEVFQGGAENDQIVGMQGADLICGGAGNDRLHHNRLFLDLTPDLAVDTLYGGQGDDTLLGEQGDVIDGGEGRDLFVSTFFDSRMGPLSLTLTQDAWISFGGVQSIHLTGIESLDISGTDGADTVTGGAGADRFVGFGGADVVALGAGNDRFATYFPEDFAADGGAGEDTLTAGPTTAVGTVLNGGAGVDTVRITGNRTALTVTMEGTSLTQGNAQFLSVERLEAFGSTAADRITGGALGDLIQGDAEDEYVYFDADTLSGMGGNDTIDGGGGRDVLTGGAGDDRLLGSGGSDLLQGDAGADRLTGGLGTDTLTGGEGADVFVLAAEEAFSVGQADLITDFVQGQDRIDLSAIDEGIPLTFLGSGVFTGQAGEVRSFVLGGVTHVRGDMDGDGDFDMALALTGALTLRAGDFHL